MKTENRLSQIAIVNLYGQRSDLPSTRRLRSIVSRAKTRYLLFNLGHTPLFITSAGLNRIADVMAQTGAAALYSDYILRHRDKDYERIALSDFQFGSVREGFDFGYAFAVDVTKARYALSRVPDDFTYAGLYDLRLRLSCMDGGIFHLQEPIYGHFDDVAMAEGQFDYVDVRNRQAQIEYEKAFTSHLKALGAWLPERSREVEVAEEAFAVTASVIIPVRNREHTIATAVESALSQVCDFDFNIIVVDNHSSDHTPDIIKKLSVKDSRVIRVDQKQPESGIGGCWNTAIDHRLCGAYAVQLDSDDAYSSPDSLRQIVETFRREHCAMVVGSYTLTDYDFNVIDPGLIDHREWTAANGHNNLLRVNGIGAPRAFATEIARCYPFPPVSYGEDYAMALRISRSYKVSRIFNSLYLCRRWGGNSDSDLSRDTAAVNDRYKDMIRSIELDARIRMNHPLR